MNNNPFIPDDDLEFKAEERANAPEPGDDAYRQDIENDLQITQEQLTDELRAEGIYLEYEAEDVTNNMPVKPGIFYAGKILLKSESPASIEPAIC